MLHKRGHTVLSLFFFFFIATLFIYLFIFSCVGSPFRARAFSSCGKRGPLFILVWGPLFIAVRGPFTIAAPLVAGHRLQTRRLSSCGSRAQSLRGVWDLPRPGLEPVSPALAGRFPTTAPPGKPPVLSLLINISNLSSKKNLSQKCTRLQISSNSKHVGSFGPRGIWDICHMGDISQGQY